MSFTHPLNGILALMILSYQDNVSVRIPFGHEDSQATWNQLAPGASWGTSSPVDRESHTRSMMKSTKGVSRVIVGRSSVRFNRKPRHFRHTTVGKRSDAYKP